MSVEYITHIAESGKTFRTLPHLEKPVAEWLAGALEVGGSIGIALNKKRGEYASPYPFIGLQDTKPPVTKWLKDNFGGTVSEKGGSQEWKVGYYVAAGMLLDIEPYVVSRREIIEAVKLWWDADNGERVWLANEMKGYDRFQGLKAEDYYDFLTRPASIGGVIDYKGLIYPRRDRKYVYPGVDVYTKNASLVEALKKKFGGYSNIRVAEGEPLAINPTSLEIYDSYQWSLANVKARNIINLTNPHLVAQPFEGWDRRLILERQQGRADEADQIGQFVTSELEDYSTKTIHRISTAEDVAKRFGLSPKTAKRRLDLLPEETRKERERILRSSNRSALTEAEVASLITAITDEVQRFQAGLITKLTYNEEWANSVEVGLHIINRRVVPLIPEEIRESRAHILRSQSTIERNKVYGNPGLKH